MTTKAKEVDFVHTSTVVASLFWFPRGFHVCCFPTGMVKDVAGTAVKDAGTVLLLILELILREAIVNRTKYC